MALFMLDTDSASFVLSGRGNVASVLVRRSPSEVCVSAITLAELRFGADHCHSAGNHGAIDALLSAVHVLPFDEAASRHFGAIAATLAQSGTPIGQRDTLIAAHALAVDATLITNDLEHFSEVPGLRVESWA